MTFHRKRSLILFDNEINGIPINRVCEMHDLEVLFDPKLSFVNHIDYFIAKAFCVLRFTMRIFSEFFDPFVLKSLYFSYVRSH